MELMTTTKRKDRFSVDAESLNNLKFMSLSTDDEFTRLAEQMQSGISLKRSRTEEVTDDLLSLRLCSAPKHRVCTVPNGLVSRSEPTSSFVQKYHDLWKML
jgi:hypothetical protein